MIRSYKDLVIWQKGIVLVTEIYKITEEFPRREIYSLTDQIRRAAISIPSNIAEGFGRNSRAEMSRYALIALGSLAELDTQMIIAFRLSYVSESVYNSFSSLSAELEALLRAFSLSLRRPKAKQSQD